MTEYFQNSINCENIPMHTCNLQATNDKCIWMPHKKKCLEYNVNQCFTKDADQCQDAHYCRMNEYWDICEKIPDHNSGISLFTNYNSKSNSNSNYKTYYYINILLNLIIIGLILFILRKPIKDLYSKIKK